MTLKKTLYSNTKAFGLLPTTTQLTLRGMRDQGHILLEYDSDGEWVNVAPKKFWLNRVYRLKRERTE